MKLRHVAPIPGVTLPMQGFANADLVARMNQQPELFLASLYGYAETMLQATLPTALANTNEKLLNLAHRTLEFMRKVLRWSLDGAALKRKMELQTQAAIAKIEARAQHKNETGGNKRSQSQSQSQGQGQNQSETRAEAAGPDQGLGLKGDQTYAQKRFGTPIDPSNLPQSPVPTIPPQGGIHRFENKDSAQLDIDELSKLWDLLETTLQSFEAAMSPRSSAAPPPTD